MYDQIKDMMGRTILPGDYIAFPVRQGSSLWMRHGKVIEVGRNHRGEAQVKVYGAERRFGKWTVSKQASTVTALHRAVRVGATEELIDAHVEATKERLGG